MLTGHLRPPLNTIPNLQQQQRQRLSQRKPKEKKQREPPREPQEQQAGKLQENRRGGRGPPKGRGHRPPTWSEDDFGAPPLPPSSGTVAPVALRFDRENLPFVHHRLLTSSESDSYTYQDISPLGTPLSLGSVSTDAIPINGTVRGAGIGGRSGNIDEAGRDMDMLRRAAAAVAASTTATGPDPMKGETLDVPQLLRPGMLFNAFQPFTVSPIVLPLAHASASAGGSDFDDVGVGREKPSHARRKYSNRSEDASVLDPSRSNVELKHPGSRMLSGPRVTSSLVDAPSLAYAFVPELVYDFPYFYENQKNAVVNGGTDDVGGAELPDGRQPPFRLSSSKRLISFDTNDSCTNGSDMGESEVSARRDRVGVSSSGSATGMPRRPTVIDLLSTFESQCSLSPGQESLRRLALESTSKAQSRYEDAGRSNPAARSERESIEVSASARIRTRVGSEERASHTGSRSSSNSPRMSRRRVRGDRISQRRSRGSGNYMGGSRRLSGGMELAGLSSDEIRSLSRGRRPRSLRSRSSDEVRP